MHWSTFGLQLGSAVVLVGIINAVFTLKSFINLAEVIFQPHYEADLYHVANLISALISLCLTIYYWIAVIFKGRGGHLILWIAGSIVIILVHGVLSSWHFLKALSTKETFHWTTFWNLLISITFDIYIIFFTSKAANVLLKKSPPDVTFPSRESTLIPIGLGVSGFWRYSKEHYVQTTNVFLTLDVILLLLKLMHGDNTEYTPYSVDNETYGWFSGGTIFLTKFEDIFLRLIRVIINLVTLWILSKRSPSHPQVLQRLWYIVISYIVVTALSLVIFISLFGTFENLSTSVRFYQFYMLIDIVFRFWILYLLVLCIEYGSATNSAGDMTIRFGAFLNVESNTDNDSELHAYHCRS